MAELVRHRQTKESATDRLHLNHRATPRLHTRAVPGRHCSDYRVNEARPFGLMITVDRAVNLVVDGGFTGAPLGAPIFQGESRPLGSEAKLAKAHAQGDPQ